VAVVVIPDEPCEVLVPGCEAASAVSQAVCKAGASITGRQLYEHIAMCFSDSVSTLPRDHSLVLELLVFGPSLSRKCCILFEFITFRV